MNYFKKFGSFVLLLLVLITIVQCGSAQKLQINTSFKLGQVYYQHWIAGVQGGGSGINLYIPIISNVNKVEFDSVYFRNKVVKLEFPNENLAIGRFKTSSNQKKDFIMSSEPYAEYGNQVPNLNKNIPFKVEDNQCIISYKDKGKIKYFKVDSIIKKELQAYPSVPKNKQ